MILRAALEQSKRAQDDQNNRTADQIRKKSAAFPRRLAALPQFHL
jgi:hypothetical protein